MTKPIPIDLTQHAHLVGGAREFLRLWLGADDRVLCFVNPRALGPDPAGFGIALVEAVRNGARAYARAVGIGEEEALARIWEGIDKERAGDWDKRASADPAATSDDGIITFTKPGRPH